ncbi:glycosyltransferase family 9 protein [Testudinibacter sp. TR-2022]|uniref:glycosyltransferase family 9 protein n=1 Tax=Testudinibacter sp. TR-2022 TaxID=2585029 RepID=UPI0011187C2B|nr:glycosyltransferase family 9 protein [Testudinibacter sp. TR-2022]TNH10437.1 glycosyltransferase family 9 protein [Testudinibacter sp. TR-2022]TNH10731.1 glycosyltransferase family 9 protein [Testudinibacter sp. TR-2022]TNH13441.1 glycosyltransferase family 9 protein [Testudinibacter sp. TR-2022]TNH14985.1 glycosyltransferase family 9 protein [Testudinibacter sp. TR-2022]
MKKIKYQLRQWRIALGKWILDKTKSMPDNIELKSVLFLRQDGKIGDYIVSSFVFRELKKYNPNLDIGVVCSDDSLFIKNPHIDHIYQVKKKNIIDYFKTGLKLRKVRYDALIDPTVFVRNRDLLLIRLINARINIGYLKQDYRLFNLNIDDQRLHFSEVYQTALTYLGLDNINTQYDIPSDPQSVIEISQFLEKNQLTDYIAINFFGAPRSRKFVAEKIRLILADLRAKVADRKIVVLTYPAVTPMLKEIIKSDNNVYLYENTTSIYQSIELIRHANLVISPDTSVIHIASGFNKKIIAFYHRHDLGLANWGPKSEEATHIVCYQDNINEINPEDIRKEWLFE